MFFLSLLIWMCTETAMAFSLTANLGLTATLGLFRNPTAAEIDRAYYRLIDGALKYRANRKLSNGKPAHAVYLLNKFFSCARRDVRVYTGRLSRSIGQVPVYADPEIVRSAIKFLRRKGSCLSIIVLGEPDVDPGQSIGSHPLLAAISKADGIRGTVRVSCGNPVGWKEFPYHFVIMDSEAARIEFDGNSADAAARFGDAHFVGRLVKIFDEFERSSSPLFRNEGAEGSPARTRRKTR